MRAAMLKLGSSPARAVAVAKRNTGVSFGRRPPGPPAGRLQEQEGSGRRKYRTWGGCTERVEHALFLVTLGTVGYLWLGAVLVQGA